MRNPMCRTRYLTLDLRDEAAAISAYEQHHAPGKVWPEVVDHLRAVGVTDMEIYRAGNRLVMVMTTSAEHTSDRHTAAATSARVAEWEALMDQYQQRLPFAEPGQKWVPMRRIFRLDA